MRDTSRKVAHVERTEADIDVLLELSAKVAGKGERLR
jgi:hypothetical protein